MDEKTVNKLVLRHLEEVRFLLTELIHDLVEEVKCVWLVHLVVVYLAAYKDNLLKIFRFKQLLKECLIFAKFSENLARIESLVHVILIL